MTDRQRRIIDQSGGRVYLATRALFLAVDPGQLQPRRIAKFRAFVIVDVNHLEGTEPSRS